MGTRKWLICVQVISYEIVNLNKKKNEEDGGAEKIQ